MRLSVFPQSVSLLADFRTDCARCEAWLISPFLRNASSRFPSPSTKLFNVLETSSIGDVHGSALKDGFTCMQNNRHRYTTKSKGRHTPVIIPTNVQTNS